MLATHAANPALEGPPHQSKRSPQRAWSLAIAASLLLHLGVASSVREGWLAFGGGLGSGLGAGLAARAGGAGTGSEGDFLIPLDLASMPGGAEANAEGSAGREAPADAPRAAASVPPAIPPEFLRSDPVARVEPVMEPLSEPVPEPLLVPPPQLVLGIDDGDESSPNWLGGPQETPHTGLPSSVNQPAWSLNPGPPGASGTGGSGGGSGGGTSTDSAGVGAPTGAEAGALSPAGPQSPPAVQPAPLLAPRPAQAGPAADTTTQVPAQAAPIRQRAEEPAPPKGPDDALGTPIKPEPEATPALTPTPAPTAPDPLALQPITPTLPAAPVDASVVPESTIASPASIAPTPVANSASSTTPNSAANPAERNPSTTNASGAAASSPGAAGGAAGGSDLQGSPSDAESQAAAVVPNVSFRPGTPLAAKGVRIITRAPRFSITARVASSPRNPTLELTFNREGKVVSGKFVEGQASGYDDIDGPILDAAMRWTATGKKLAEVLGDDPKATFTVRITYLLNAQ